MGLMFVGLLFGGKIYNVHIRYIEYPDGSFRKAVIEWSKHE